MTSNQGRPFPWGKDAFSLCFRIPPIFDKFLKFYLFLKKFSIFIRQNCWWPFFSHRPKISNFPPFSLFGYIPSVSRQFLFPPYFDKFPSVFEKFTCFLHTLCIFRFPPLRRTSTIPKLRRINIIEVFKYYIINNMIEFFIYIYKLTVNINSKKWSTLQNHFSVKFKIN